MQANESWDWSEEPEWILVFLDEWEKLFELDKDYQNKWDEYKNWMFKNTWLNMDHRLVSKDSTLRWHQLFDIAYDFFTLYNIIQWKKFKNININRVGQIQTIQRLLKLWFQFINQSEKSLFQSIIKNPENRDTISYKTTYWDIIKNMIIKKWNAKTKENLIIFQMIYNL
jgi:hypothetical protein